MIRYKPLYIAKRLKVEENDYGMEIETFDKPKAYQFLYMPTSGKVEYQVYGERISRMFTCFVPYDIYLGTFHEGDRAYLIDESLQDVSIAKTDNNCKNANYRIISVLPQNRVIKLTFEKINNK